MDPRPVRRILGKIGSERGRGNEKRVLDACKLSERPSWMLAARRATPSRGRSHQRGDRRLAPLTRRTQQELKDGESCYMFSMTRPKQRRAGATETFSVSVDPETKKALRNLADADYGGNLSALVTDLAEEARRRMAAGAYLRRRAIPPLDGAGAVAVEAVIEREVASARRQRKGRHVA